MSHHRTLTGCLSTAALVVCLAQAPAAGSLHRASKSTSAFDQQRHWDRALVSSVNVVLLKYARLSAWQQKWLEPAAMSAARQRRTSMKRLIVGDPRLALALSLSPAQRVGLPPTVLNLLETRWHGRGDLVLTLTEEAEVDIGQDHNRPAVSPKLTWFVRLGQATWRAFPYGLRLGHQTKYDTPLHGIALDDVMAVDESPVYRYDPLETVRLGFQPGQIVATAGGLPIPLNDLDALADLRRDLLEQVLRFGPIPTPEPDTWTTGLKRLLVIMARARLDDEDTPLTTAEITIAVSGANTFFQENSQHRVAFDVTIHEAPVTTRAYTLDDYRAMSGPNVAHEILGEQAIGAARAAGYEPDTYDRVIVLARQIFRSPMATARIGGRVVVVTGRTLRPWETLAHELGHTFGFPHSDFWRVPPGASPISPDGEPRGQGDYWDIMGMPHADTGDDWRRRHFNGYFKALAGWLPSGSVMDATEGGSFRLRPHDTAGAVGVRAISIDAPDGTTYWLDMRRQFPWNVSMVNGIEVRRVVRSTPSAVGPVVLLDMDNRTPGDIQIHHSLLRAGTFVDPGNGIRISVGNVGEDAGGPYADVGVVR